ncbi:hypothetical protein ISCGN_030864 [Ixodes scapularis]
MDERRWNALGAPPPPPRASTQPRGDRNLTSPRRFLADLVYSCLAFTTRCTASPGRLEEVVTPPVASWLSFASKFYIRSFVFCKCHQVVLQPLTSYANFPFTKKGMNKAHLSTTARNVDESFNHQFSGRTPKEPKKREICSIVF